MEKGQLGEQLREGGDRNRKENEREQVQSEEEEIIILWAEKMVQIRLQMRENDILAPL